MLEDCLVGGLPAGGLSYRRTGGLSNWRTVALEESILLPSSQVEALEDCPGGGLSWWRTVLVEDYPGRGLSW